MEKRSRDFSISYVNKVVHNRRNIYFHGAISREAKLFFNPRTTFSQFQSRINIRLCKSIDSGWVINEISVASLKNSLMFPSRSSSLSFSLLFSFSWYPAKGSKVAPWLFPRAAPIFSQNIQKLAESESWKV